MDWIEAIGLAASILVLISFLFNNEATIRIVNIVGATLFVVYGALLGALSVWLLNGLLILVHCWKLYKVFKNRPQKLKYTQTVYNYKNDRIQK